MKSPLFYIYAWNGLRWREPHFVIGLSFGFSRSSWEGLSDLNSAYRQKTVFENYYPSHHFLVLAGDTKIRSYPPP